MFLLSFVLVKSRMKIKIKSRILLKPTESLVRIKVQSRFPTHKYRRFLKQCWVVLEIFPLQEVSALDSSILCHLQVALGTSVPPGVKFGPPRLGATAPWVTAAPGRCLLHSGTPGWKRSCRECFDYGLHSDTCSSKTGEQEGERWTSERITPCASLGKSLLD